jgi:hypothetical protein
MDHILVREENLWVQYKTSRLQNFKSYEFGYIAELRNGEERIQVRFTKHEIRQIWNSLSLRQRTQLTRSGYASEQPLTDFLGGWHGPLEDSEERIKRLIASI